MRLSIIFLVGALLQMSLATGESVRAQVEKEMDARSIAFQEAFNKGDAGAMKAMYADDAMLLSFDGRVIRGSGTISQGMAMFSKQVDLELKPLRSSTSGDLRYEAGTWRHLKKGSQSEVGAGTYVWVWKKDAKGVWRIETQSVTMRAESKGGVGSPESRVRSPEAEILSH